MKKRIISLFVVLTFLLSFMPNVVFATDSRLTDGTSKATIYFDYMKLHPDYNSMTGMVMTDSTYTTPMASAIATPDRSAINAGEKMVLGIRLSDFRNIAKAQAQGLESMSIVFNYNTTVLSFDDSNLAGVNMMMRGGMMSADNLFSNVGGAYKLNTDGSSADTSTGEVKWAVSPASGGNNPQPYTGAQDAYIAYLIFTYNVNGSQIADGTKLFTPVENTAQYNISLGGGTPSYEYSEDSTVLDIRPLIAFDTTNVNVAPATYTVTYDVTTNGGTATSSTATDYQESVSENALPSGYNDSNVDISTLLTPPNNMIFKGWSDNATDTTPALTKPTAAKTVYAIYGTGHKVSFDLNDSSNTAEFADNTKAKKTISKDMNVALLGSSETINSVIGNGAPTRTGYTFKGWFEKDSTTGAFKMPEITDATLQAATTQSYDLYAMWELDNPDAVLDFDNNGGATAASPASVGFSSSDSTSTIPDIIGGMPSEPTKANYAFTGWFKNEFGLGDELTSSSVVSTYTTGMTFDTQTPPHTKVYARYDSDDANKIEIKFAEDTAGSGQYGGGTCTATGNATIPSYYVNYGDTLSAIPDSTIMTHSTKAFDGWYTQANGQGTKVTTSTVIDNTLDSNTSLAAATAGQVVTLYPYWVDQLTVQYNANALPNSAYTGGMPTDSTKYTPGDTTFVPAQFTSTDAKYTVKSWNTKPNGSGTSYKLDGSQQTFVSSDSDDGASDGVVTLYAIWDYDVTQTDAISITFKTNDDGSINQATLNPNNGLSAAKEYTIVRLKDTTIDANHLPTAARSNYVFSHWGKTKTEALTTAQDLTVTDESGNNGKSMTRYAIWDVDPNAATYDVTFQINKPNSTGTATPSADFVVKVPQGDCLGSRMPSDPTFVPDYAFDKWTYVSGGTGDFDDTKLVTGNTTVQANWTQEVKLTFDANGGTVDTTAANPSTADITLDVNTKVESKTSGPTTLPVVKKDGYTFDGWFYTDSVSGNLVEIKKDTVIDKSYDLKAKWTALIKITYTTDKFDYDGTGKTPFTTINSAKNYTVTLLDPADSVTSKGTLSFEPSDFVLNYKKQGEADTAYSTTEPIDVGIKNIKVEISSATGSKYGDDPYTEYSIVNYPNTFEIEAATINYVIKHNYQYTTAGTFTPVEIATAQGTTLTPDVDVFNSSNRDIDIKFTNKKNSSDVYTNTMPTNYGEYDIDITAASGSNYKVGTWTDEYQNVTPKGDADLHLMNPNRVVKVDYTGTGAKQVGNTTTLGVVTYTTVVIPTPNPVTNISAATTTLATQNPAKTLPQAGTDYDNPDGKTIDRFIYKVDDGNGGTNDVAFTAATPITFDAADLVIYPEFKDASWQVTFKDTKTNPAAEANKVYTVEALKAIEDTNAVQKVDGTAVTAPNIPDDVPTPSAAPANMMFGGWTTDQTLANTANLKASDLTNATNSPKMFTKASKPGDGNIAAGTSSLDVYAVYVLSSDATLSNAEFKETDNTGNVLAFVDNTYSTPQNAITFDPTVTDYYIVTDKDIAKIFGDLTPTNSDSVITVEKQATPSNTSVATTPANGKGQSTINPDVEATKYDSNTNTNSANVFVVTVTAPDGTTTKTYTFNVLRYAEAKISLHYGNSPYGEIMKASNIADADKQAAKDAFNTGNVYKAPYIPTAVQDKLRNTPTGSLGLNTNITEYPYRAWVDAQSISGATAQQLADLADPDINMDRNDYSIFIYNTKHFVDPGFDATDSMDRPITNVTRTITVNRMNTMDINGIYDGNYTPQNITISNQPSNYLVTEVTKPYNQNDPLAFLIRPDKYTMTYSFTDPVTGDTITEDRYVIVLQRRGDSNFSSSINLQDLNPIYQWFNKNTTYFKTSGSDHVLTGTARLIYAYRCLDLRPTNQVNLQDLNPIYQKFNKFDKATAAVQAANLDPVTEWYNELPNQ